MGEIARFLLARLARTAILARRSAPWVRAADAIGIAQVMEVTDYHLNSAGSEIGARQG